MAKTTKKTAEKAATEAVREAAERQWWLSLDVKKNDITVLLFYPHGGRDPKTGKYVMGIEKQSPNWTGEENPVHMKDIFYEGIGMRHVVDRIKAALDYMKVNCKIVNFTWEDTPIHKKRSMAQAMKLDFKKVFGLEPHANATKNLQGDARGFEIFTWPGKSASDDHALIYGQEFEKSIPDTPHRRFKANEEKEARFGILRLDPIESKEKGFPIVLTECGFMDDEAFCKAFLMQEEGLEKIAAIHVRAILRIINKFY